MVFLKIKPPDYKVYWQFPKEASYKKKFTVRRPLHSSIIILNLLYLIDVHVYGSKGGYNG